MEVVRASFKTRDQMSVDELFGNFHNLRAITYSSGLDFMLKVLSDFEDAEVVFGSRTVLDQSLATIMSFQRELIGQMALPKNAKRLSERIDNETLRLFVTRDMRSHEKLFLLEGDAHTRVIMGSANFSASAFHERQREVVTVFDDDPAAWDYYLKRYESLRDICSNHLDPKLLKEVTEDKEHLDDHPDDLPVIAKIDSDTIVIDETEPKEFKEELVFVADVRGHEKEIRRYAPSPKCKKGITVIKPKSIVTMMNRVHEFRQQFKLQRQEMPVLDLDYERGTLTFNGEKQDLNPAGDQIERDIKCLVGYIDSLADLFHGHVGQTQFNFWKFACWYFGSIFAARMRYEANLDNYEVTNIPVIGIMYGDSNAGKSTFTRLLARLMCGKRVELSPSKAFTYKNLADLRANCKGLPIHIDDLTRDQWNRHSENIVKDDRYGMNNPPLLLNYPAICISTNNVPSLKPEISKRVVACKVSARIDRDVGSRMTKRVNTMFNSCGNALFCEFVRTMLPRIEDMVDQMRAEDNDYFPDLFALSSSTLCEIADKYLEKRPAWMREVAFDDYFGDKAISQSAVDHVRRAWLSDPKAFSCNERENKLVWSLPEGASVWELHRVADELPAHLDAKVTGRSLVMNLSDARELFGQTFKRSLWKRIVG